MMASDAAHPEAQSAQAAQVDLDVDPYWNEPAQKIRAAWETSMEALHPLLKDMEATDRLIDRIVYRLYGLTEEEVGVVEGRLKQEGREGERKGTKGVSCVSCFVALVPFRGFVFRGSPADAERGFSVMAKLRIAERRKTRRGQNH